MWVSGGAYRVSLAPSDPPDPNEDDEFWVPLLELGGRTGLSQRVDLEARLGTGGGSIGPRFQLLRSTGEDGTIDVLVETSVGWTALFAHEDPVTGVSGAVSIPVGVNFGGGSQLVATPRAAWMSGSTGGLLLAGGSLALVLRLAGRDARTWYLIPECGVAATSGRSDVVRGPIVQCAIGVAGPGPLGGLFAAF